MPGWLQALAKMQRASLRAARKQATQPLFDFNDAQGEG